MDLFNNLFIGRMASALRTNNMMIKIKIKNVTLLILIFSASSLAALELPPAELFVRCYSHMTGLRPQRNDALLAQVKAGTKTYVVACMELFAKAKFDSTGVITAKVGASPDPIAQRVLQTFSSFHNTWFSNLDYGSKLECTQFDVIDNQEMSYHITNALFRSRPYSEVITSDQTYAAIRISPNNVNNTSSRVCPDYALLSGVKFVSTVNTVPTWDGRFRNAKWTPYIPEVGTLVGIKPMPDEPFVPYLSGVKQDGLPDPYENYDPTSTYATTKSEIVDSSLIKADFNPNSITTPSSVKIHKSYGSGIIGTVPYFVLNNGRNDSFKADGVVNVARRWSKNVLRDVLCRELPVLRNEDVTAFVQPTSSTPFRASASCVRCHNTMDPLAYGIRNLSTTRAHNNYDSSFNDESGNQYVYDIPGKTYSLHKTLFVRKYPLRDQQASSFTRLTADARFHLQPPDGKLNFRDIYGVLHSQSFSDLQGTASLGNYLKTLDDYYVCAAKRYYNFFTGINVPIYDYADPTLPPPSADELKHRNIVLKLGLDLKTSQSLELMVRDILSLDVYKLQGFGTK